MSRVTLGISFVVTMLFLPLSSFLSAQDRGSYGESDASATEPYGAEYGEPESPAVGGHGRGEYGGRATGGYGRGGEYGQAEAPGEKPVQKGRESRRGPGSDVKDIDAVLDSKLKAPLQYEEQPLNEVVATLQEEYNIPILFDYAALDEVAISPDTEVTIALKDISLRSALRLVLRQSQLQDLTFIVEDEVLLITTQDKANDQLEVMVYRVDDLVTTSKGGLYNSLAETITRCVSSDTWAANDTGEGEIQLMYPGMLVVTNTRRIQDQVVDLLYKLRTTRQDIEQRSEGEMTGRGYPGGF